MLSKRPSVAVRMMSPSWTSKEELSAASGLEGTKAEAVRVWKEEEEAKHEELTWRLW